jgi:hypothetical protein
MLKLRPVLRGGIPKLDRDTRDGRWPIRLCESNFAGRPSICFAAPSSFVVCGAPVLFKPLPGRLTILPAAALLFPKDALVPGDRNVTI